MKNPKIVVTDNTDKWKSNHIKSKIMRGFSNLPLYTKGLILLQVVLGVELSLIDRDIIRN